jgi:peptidoglycan L-alanyl-D-glutamate endopeptidase CwlK
MSRSLDDLRPEIRPMVDAWLAACAAVEIDILVTCTLRSNEDQAVLYASGRTVHGPIRTNAKPGQSAHNYGLALDVVPVVHGSLDWSGDSPTWKHLAELGQAAGLAWLGAPGSPFIEQAHFQHPEWKNLAGVSP